VLPPGNIKGESLTMVDIEELKSRFLNLEFDVKGFVLDPDKVAAVARLSGEPRAEFTDPNHPEFQASPAFVASLSAGRHLPIDFPRLGGIPMDGGKAVTCLRPVPVGVPLTGRTHLHEIYDKSGRSGRMIFLVSRMELFDAAGNQLAINDARMVIREKHTDGN
jgi:hypothetical protein